jgi:molybdopterin molybdotransferase
LREFFTVVSLAQAAAHIERFPPVGSETIPLAQALGRVMATDVVGTADLPGFRRSTMDGFAVQASSTFGATEGSPALLDLVGAVEMGVAAQVHVGPGQAARILTGGMLPEGADAVVMVEHTQAIDAQLLEASRSVAPAQNVIAADEDLAAGQLAVRRGVRLRPQECGLLAALGWAQVPVMRRPIVAILSTGDEVVPVDRDPGPGQIRDVNATTLAALVAQAGGDPLGLGIVGDDLDSLLNACRQGLARADTLLLSGGSSVGTRDLTLEVLAALDHAEVLVHGVAIKPGKPTILATVGTSPAKAVWGLPGHVASAMVVFDVLVRPYLAHLAGLSETPVRPSLSARISRGIASVHGRVDFLRVRVEQRDDGPWAVPVLGRSGLLRSMVRSHGLVRIDRDTEGLDGGDPVLVTLF